MCDLKVFKRGVDLAKESTKTILLDVWECHGSATLDSCHGMWETFGKEMLKRGLMLPVN